MKQRIERESGQQPSNIEDRTPAGHQAPFVDNRSSAATQRKLAPMIAQGTSAQRKQMTLLSGATAQRMNEGEEDPLQRAGMDEQALPQAALAESAPAQLAQQEAPKANDTGLPNQLKSGIENLSGMSMDHVKVHYNSAQPAQLNAHAFAQGSEIHVGPGQERHVPHEAWHVVQQAQGRVKPTMQMKGAAVNDDAGLEHEADVMGAKAVQYKGMPTEDAEKDSYRSQEQSMVQLKEVRVSGGAFKDLDYSAQNGGGKLLTKGARMILEFKPSEHLDAKEVSLVQTTNSTLVNLTDPHVPDQPESLLDERRTPSGTAIDQQIFLPERKFQINPFKSVIKPAVVNLDPRYHEERHTVNDPLYDPRKIMFGGGQAAIEYTEQQKLDSGAEDRWRPAMLKDQPGHDVPPNQLLAGGEKFEVAAMADGKLFLGSIRWGWKINDSTQLAELDPGSIELVSQGSASAEFFAAAEAWNAMPVTDRKTGQVHSTIQLPTLTSIKKLKTTKRLTMWVQGVLKRYTNAQQFHFDTLTNADFGEFLLTGKIASWENEVNDVKASENQAVLQRTINDLFEVYPQGEQYLKDLSHEQFGEFLVTGKIDAWER